MDQYAAHGAAIAALTSGEERYAGSPMFSALPNAPTVDDAPWWRRLRPRRVDEFRVLVGGVHAEHSVQPRRDRPVGLVRLGDAGLE